MLSAFFDPPWVRLAPALSLQAPSNPPREHHAKPRARTFATPYTWPAKSSASSPKSPRKKVVVARQRYGEQLTSARYRGWIHHLSIAVRNENAADKGSHLDTLSADAKAAGKTSCWFADTLRH